MNQMMKSIAIAKTHLGFRGMNIDIDLIRRNLQEEENDRIAAGHEQAAIAFLQGMTETAIANPTAIEEDILHLGRAPLARRVSNPAVQLDRALANLKLVKVIA